MKVIPIKPRTTLPTCLSVNLLVASAAFGNANTAIPPKVEFVEQKDHQCLQPVVHDKGAVLADYRDAEAQWLATKYQGNSVRVAKTALLLSPAQHAGEGSTPGQIQRETLYFEGVVGPKASICFDINLAIDPAQPHD